MKQLWQYYKQIFSQQFIDRTISGGIKGQITLLLVVILSVLAIASIIITSLRIGLSDEKEWGEQMWILYNNFVDPGNQLSQNNWTNRLTVCIISLLGSILLGGVLISTISNIIERRVEAIRTGKVFYKSICNHYVIIGYGDITASLIKELHKENPRATILVMSSQECEHVRHNLQIRLNKEEEQHVYIYFGNIESIEELERLNIDKAKEVYILGEQDDYGRDSKNIQCVHLVCMLRGENNKDELPVYTQFYRQASYSVVQKINIINTNTQTTKRGSNIYFRPFNFHENWARKLWTLYAQEEGNPYDTLDYDPICFLPNGDLQHPDKYVHLVIIGFGGMGQALLLEALRVCHFANYDDQQDSNSRIRTQITLIDKNMETLKQHFISQYPNLETQIDDIQITYHHEDACNQSILDNLKRWSEDPQKLLTIAICISDPDESITLGLNLPGEIYQSETRVLIRQEIQTDLGEIIHKDQGRYRHVKIFGMIEQGISKNILQDEIPSYINQEYEDMYNTPNRKNEFIKNLYNLFINKKQIQFTKEKVRARTTWIGLEENIRWANRYQIDAYLTYLHTLGYKVERVLNEEETIASVNAFIQELKDKKLTILMRMEKHRWNAERTIEGWRYGEERDDIHRIHDKILPFHKISKEVQLKDKSVIINLPYLLAITGYKLSSL